MAKKKNSALHQLLFTPISLPLFGILALIGTSLLSLNLSFFVNQQVVPSPAVATITQNTLQNVLGTSFSIGEDPTYQSPASDPIVNYWQEVTHSKNNYRDGYIALAISSFNKRNCQDTRFYLDKAYDIDPDSQAIQELITPLKSCLDQK